MCWFKTLFIFILLFHICLCVYVAPKCGQQIKKTQSTSLVVSGFESFHGQWPWLASLHKMLPPPWYSKYFCGATLINHNNLVTAAHCIYPSLKDDIFALLGRFNIENSTMIEEHDWEHRNIIRKIVHEDYIHEGNTAKSNADIAVLFMDSPVDYTAYIQPICLPSTYENVFETNGIVAGYGRTGEYDPPTKTPQYIHLETINLAVCYATNELAFYTLSLQSFCARSDDGIPCYGDSGSGFIKEIKGSWTLLGIVSQTLDTKCKTGGHVVLVNVPKFLGWLNKTLNSHTASVPTTKSPSHVIYYPNDDPTSKCYYGLKWTNMGCVQCTDNSDCKPQLEVCMNSKCMDVNYLCKSHNCGSNNRARCEVVNYLPTCKCINHKYKWSQEVLDCIQCSTNEECEQDEVCDIGECISACKKFSCNTQYGAQCLAKNHKPQCVCQRGGNWFTSDSSCRFCSNDSECPDSKFCYKSECVYACSNYCGLNARCIYKEGRDHCECVDGYIKDAYGQCKKADCKNLNCPLYSTCYQDYDKAECRCIDGLLLNSARKECQFVCDGGFRKFSLTQKCNNFRECYDESDERQCIKGRIEGNYWENDCMKNPSNKKCRFGPLRTFIISKDTIIDTRLQGFSTNLDKNVEKLKNERENSKTNNLIKFLPFGLYERFPNLKQIDITFCAIKELFQENLKGLKKLKVLNLSRNKIEKIDEKSFSDLESLEEIYININKIKILPEKVFDNLRSLETINLAGNQLENLPKNLFENCEKLKLIDLSANQISSLSSQIFRYLYDLEKINFSYNKIKQLTGDIFQNNRKLKEIDFEYNDELIKISSNIFDGLNHLMTIDLGSKSCMKNSGYYDSRTPLTSEQKLQLKRDLLAKCS